MTEMWGLRGELLDGRLVLAPPAPRRHDRVMHHLAARFRLALPPDVAVSVRRPLHLSGGDAPVPDLTVSTGAAAAGRPTTAAMVHTACEVVSADGRYFDQVYKPQRYADAGIPCCWRIQLVAWPGYRGALPLVVVRLREPAGWTDIVAAAGRVHTLPVAYRRAADGAAVTTTLRLDPSTLLVRTAATR